MAKKANPPGAIRPVTTATLIKRLRRHFAAQNEVFHVARTEREYQLWGPFYVTAGRFNVIVDQLPFLDIRARELGILKNDEPKNGSSLPPPTLSRLTDGPPAGRHFG